MTNKECIGCDGTLETGHLKGCEYYKLWKKHDKLRIEVRALRMYKREHEDSVYSS